MREKKIFTVMIQAVVVTYFSVVAVSSDANRPGWVGQRFGETDLTNLKNAEVIDSFEHLWSENDDRGGSWSSRWRGYIVSPATGEITFHVETNRRLTMNIGTKELIRIPGEVDPAGVFQFLQSQSGHIERSAAVNMIAGKHYPIIITYVLEDGAYGYLRVKWRWEGQDLTSIPRENILHTLEQEWEVNWSTEPVVDCSSFVTVPVRHVLVYGKSGRFAGWPANDGLWSWGDELLIGFHEATYEKVRALNNAHSLNRGRPRRNLLARSLDGGETWEIEDPQNYAGDGGKPRDCPGCIKFTHPDFAMQCRGDQFRISYDRGRSWEGPYKLPDIKRDLTARTDYIVNSENEYLFFLVAKEQKVQSFFQDRAFCAMTTDGAKTIKFLSWMTDEPVSVRSVMPSTVRISVSHLVSALQRRLDVHIEDDVDYSRDWINAYELKDNGKSWEFLSKVDSVGTSTIRAPISGGIANSLPSTTTLPPKCHTSTSWLHLGS